MNIYLHKVPIETRVVSLIVTCDYCRVLILLIFLYLKPKQIMEIKDFLLTARRQDAKCKRATCGSLCALIYYSNCNKKVAAVPVMT